MTDKKIVISIFFNVHIIDAFKARKNLRFKDQ